jgi:hypothetical protein
MNLERMLFERSTYPSLEQVLENSKKGIKEILAAQHLLTFGSNYVSVRFS